MIFLHYLVDIQNFPATTKHNPKKPQKAKKDSKPTINNT